MPPSFLKVAFFIFITKEIIYMTKCKIIAIANQKGGVGKTTTTVNLGIGLAALGNRVLLVDGDPQGSLSVAMGIPNQDVLTETLGNVMLAEISDQDIPVDYGILHHKEGVDLLPANIELSGVELTLYSAMSRETVMRNILHRQRPYYDYILIDCMPSLGLMTINALAAADAVIIPSQPNYLSTKGLNLLLHSIAKVKKQINPQLTGQRQRRMVSRRMPSGDAKPQSAQIPFTCSGRGSSAAISTVAAPMEMPERRICVSGPKRRRISFVQLMQSNRSFTPKEMVLPSLWPWAR